MIQWNAEKLRYFTVLAERNMANARRSISEKGRGRKLTSDDRESMRLIIDDFKQVCRDAEMKLTLDACVRATNRCSHPSREFYVEDLETLLEDIVNAMPKEFHTKKFCYIPESKAQFFENDELFGEQVNKAFPSAKADIKDAGNCLAVDLNTAAIFHLMRVAEFGLRALARHLKVAMRKMPVEYAEWGKVIAQIEEQIKLKKPKARGKKQSDTLEFYHGIMGEFNAFKDVWRNNVMHSRRSYDEKEAMAAYIRVQNFMQRLAAKISESGQS